MNSVANVAKILAFLIPLQAIVSTVSGCGLMPPGQGIEYKVAIAVNTFPVIDLNSSALDGLTSTRNFNLSGFTLPTAMVFSTMAGVPAQVLAIASSMAGAQAFVSRIVMQAVVDVLEQQGRGAGLSDAIIAIILGQLTIQIIYTPLECKEVTVNQNPAMQFGGNTKPHCIIVGNTVTSLCTDMRVNMWDINKNMGIGTIPAQHLSISGSLTTTNIIMANWSREMWQGVVKRADRLLASGPFGTNFFSAFATVT